tara:strand:+ start:3602 stop:5038 length:1437 start_codon:yes stop_codon:yes gene_type:complete
MAGWFAALKGTAVKGASKATAARNFIRPKGKGGGGASPQDPDKIKVEAKRIKTTPSILKVKSLTFRKIGDSNTFIKFIGSAGSELNKVKIPDKRGLLSRMNLAGSGNSAMNMLLATMVDPGGVAKTAGMSLGVGAALAVPGIIGLRQLFKKKPNIKPNIKPNKIKGPKIKSTIKKPKINKKPNLNTKPNTKLKVKKPNLNRINAKNNIVKTNRITKPNLNLNKGGGILKRLKNIKGVSKSNVVLNTVFAGFEFADRKSSGQTNTQAAIGTGSSLAGGIAGAAIGQTLIPIPVVGALIGGGIGSWISTKLADKATGADKIGSEETEEKKNEIDGQEDLNKITEQVRIKSQKLNGIVDKFDDHVMALASLMDRRPETKDKMIYTEGGSIESATVNVNNTNNINTKLKVDQSMITSISNDDSEDTIFITQQSPPMNLGQGGGMIPIPVGGGGGGLAVATQSESELVNSVWSNILLTKLASK